MYPKRTIPGFYFLVTFPAGLLDRRLLSYELALVIELAFTLMGAVAHMKFPGSTVFAEGHLFGLVMGPPLCAALLGVPSFRIWHILSLNIPEFIKPLPDRVLTLVAGIVHFLQHFKYFLVALWTADLIFRAHPVRGHAQGDELIDPAFHVQVTLAPRYIMNVGIFFLIVHFLRVIHQLYQHFKIIPKLLRERVPTTIALHIGYSAHFKLQQHEGGVLLQQQTYFCLYIGKVLRRVGRKELAIYFVAVFVDTGLQTDKCYIKFPASGHNNPI